MKDDRTEKLLRVGESTLQTAFEFETELRELFGFNFIDGELDTALLPAIELILNPPQKVTKKGLAVAALYTLMKGHPRGFGRYYAGADRPYPRPSAEIKAEIDSGRPTYIAYLFDELKDALEEERQAG
jgi:hypothetical protein